jgi:hypothetical protein
MYSPTLGRFLSPDNITPGGPEGLNRYAYGLNNPVKYIDPTGHTACSDLPSEQARQYCNSQGKINGKGGLPGFGDDSGYDSVTDIPKKDDSSNDDLVKGFKIAAAVSQDIATGIDAIYATAEVVFLSIGLGGGPETIPVVITGMDIFFNVTGGNAAETTFSLISLVSTIAADYLDDGKLGEDSLTSGSTFGLGLIMPDPMGDLAIDGYASSYTHGIFNGVNTIMNGGPIWRGKWRWY